MKYFHPYRFNCAYPNYFEVFHNEICRKSNMDKLTVAIEKAHFYGIDPKISQKVFDANQNSIMSCRLERICA